MIDRCQHGIGGPKRVAALQQLLLVADHLLLRDPLPAQPAAEAPDVAEIFLNRGPAFFLCPQLLRILLQDLFPEFVFRHVPRLSWSLCTCVL